MNAPTIEAALADITQKLLDMGRPFALVGGLAVSFRAEVRFTRDVDLAVVVKGDADFEALGIALRSSGARNAENAVEQALAADGLLAACPALPDTCGANGRSRSAR